MKKIDKTFFCKLQTIVYERRDDYVLKCIYSGYKFETMGSEAKTNDRADNHPKNDFLRNEMSCVYETNFNGFNVLFAAEIDSFDKSWTAEKITKPKRARELGALEMKTSSVVATDNMYLTLRKKMVRWWAQIRLIDCDEVICGYRTREFKLHHIDHLSVKDLNHNRQQMTAHCKDSWLFLNDTLQLLREQVQNEDAFYEISYEPYSRRFKTKMVPKCDDINRYKRLICTEYEMFVNSFAKN